MHIGLISDTHGLLRPAALDALTGCERIVHAGDVGSPEVLSGLARLAPVTAIRGNNDTAAWARELPDTTALECSGRRLYVLHDIKELAIDPVAERIAVLVAGHSHRPSHRVEGGVHFVNPGSAGPRRFRLPVTVARLIMSTRRIDVELVTLDV
jgi:putative phosphoesterase